MPDCSATGPAPLQYRFAELWHRFGAATQPEPVFASLHAAYAEPHRAYHNLAHLLHCLEELDAARFLAVHPDEIEIALWFHDSVYKPLAKDNEVRSAAWAEEEMLGAGSGTEVVERVKALILATKHDVPPVSPEAQFIVDIDLAILGQPAPRFDAYEAGILQEYAMVPAEQFRAGRAAILEAFLQRPLIYHTDHFRRKYEAAARANLTRSLRRLRT